MKLKLFQKQDLARAALHDGLILSWDTGLGKTWALFLWPLLKVGYVKVTDGHPLPSDGRGAGGEGFRIEPKAPVLIIAPGDLHQQILDEGWTRFRIRVTALDSQATFGRLVSRPSASGAPTVLPNLTADGRPILPPGFYITSYTQLTTNGVQSLPDAMDWPDPTALLQWLCLKVGAHVPNADPTAQWMNRPDFADVCSFFAWRGIKWKDEYHRLSLDPDDTLKDLETATARELESAAFIQDPRLRAAEERKINEAHAILKLLLATRPCPRFEHLSPEQQAFVIRAFCAGKIERYDRGNGTVKEYPIGPKPEGYIENQPETDTRLKWRVKCLYSPSLSDLSYNAFEAVAIDEGVKMKGEETFVGKGVRQMAPKYRLVLTATPVKNRLPDIFRLAWWATGGRSHAHARFPYRDDTTERNKFAQTFMVTERNLTKEKEAAAKAAEGRRFAAMTHSAPGSSRPAGGSRFVKLTAEVCNVHRLWKLLGPIVLRRRKDDCNEDIVPKIRKVIRCEMGTHQQKVYKYHLQAKYTDKNGDDAIGAQLQALRMAAADPSSSHLVSAGGTPTEECECRKSEGPLPPRTSDLALPTCVRCAGPGRVPLPHRSGQPYIPKLATTMTLIAEIIERKEQVVVFSAFTDPLDHLGGWLDEAGVRHCKLDGRVSQKKRGKFAAAFKRGRSVGQTSGLPVAGTSGPTLSPPTSDLPLPVMLAGVECMAEGHSFHLANNVILIAYSWAYDKFIQALNRVHRMNSQKPVNVYVVICTGTIDRKLESLIQDKGDAAELVLDGRLIGERTEEVNLAELLRIAQKEFDGRTNTLDEALLQAQWPALRAKLSLAMQAWDDLPALASARVDHQSPFNPTKTKRMNNSNNPRNNPINIPKPIAPGLQTPAQPALTPPRPASVPNPTANGDWRARMKANAERIARVQKADLWSSL